MQQLSSLPLSLMHLSATDSHHFPDELMTQLPTIEINQPQLQPPKNKGQPHSEVQKPSNQTHQAQSPLFEVSHSQPLKNMSQLQSEMQKPPNEIHQAQLEKKQPPFETSHLQSPKKHEPAPARAA